MSKVKIQGHASGTGVLTVTAPNTSTDRTITLPDGTGTLLTTDGDGSSLTGIQSPLVEGTDYLAPDGDGSSLTGVGVDGISSSATSTAITIDSSENVGIGEPTPQALLHIKGNTPVIRISDANSTSEDDATGKIEFYDRNTDLNGYIQCGSGSSSDLILNAYNNKAIIFQNNGTTERFRITNDGRGLSQFTAKGWINMKGTGTIAINDSHNVSSIADGGTGDYDIFWDVDLANANYSATATNTEVDAAGWVSLKQLAVSSVSAISSRHDSASLDTASVSIVVFGD